MVIKSKKQVFSLADQIKSPVGRFFVKLADVVSRVCANAPLPLGIAVIGMTIASFALLLAGAAAVPFALCVGIVGGIILIVLTDYLPGWCNSIVSHWVKEMDPQAVGLTYADDEGEAHGYYAA